jgi:hypothetical protein
MYKGVWYLCIGHNNLICSLLEFFIYGVLLHCTSDLRKAHGNLLKFLPFQVNIMVVVMVLNALSTIFQFYRSGQYYWWRKLEYPGKTTDLPQVRQTLSHIVVSNTSRHEWIQNHNVSGDQHWLHIVVDPTTMWSRPWRPQVNFMQSFHLKQYHQHMPEISLKNTGKENVYKI